MIETETRVEAGCAVFHQMFGSYYSKEIKIPAGQEFYQHMHNYSHVSVLAVGEVTLYVDDVPSNVQAPSCLFIEAGKRHRIVAIKDAVWYCIHAVDKAYQ